MAGTNKSTIFWQCLKWHFDAFCAGNEARS